MEIRHRILGVMFTMTTYGTWLRGDERGWVEDGKTFPANPNLEAADRSRLKHDPFLFESGDWLPIGDAIGRSLIDRLGLRLLAMAVQSWHVHFVVAESKVDAADVARCAKEAARYLLRAGRPIWTNGYDKRFCTDEASLLARIAYVERHNLELGWPAKPWQFLF